jgi:hypothetical protein
VLKAADHKAKHRDWHSKLKKVPSCLITSIETSALSTVRTLQTRYLTNTSLIYSDTFVIMELVLPMHLAFCSALGSGHLHIMIDTTRR